MQECIACCALQADWNVGISENHPEVIAWTGDIPEVAGAAINRQALTYHAASSWLLRRFLLDRPKGRRIKPAEIT
jgi:hypothetical protein